jgi:pimeloyl-ACP methyl ester carboxylesterase
MLWSLHDTSDCKQVESGLWTFLENMTWPVLVIRGEGSAVLARGVAEQMIKVLPDGHFRSVRCAGHNVMSDNPEGFVDAVLPFFREL